MSLTTLAKRGPVTVSIKDSFPNWYEMYYEDKVIESGTFSLADLADFALTCGPVAGLLVIPPEKLRQIVYDNAMQQHAGCDGPISCGCGFCHMIADRAANAFMEAVEKVVKQ